MVEPSFSMSWPIPRTVLHAAQFAVGAGSCTANTRGQQAGGFGPLQALPVNAVLDFTLKPEANGTRLTIMFTMHGETFLFQKFAEHRKELNIIVYE